MLFLRGRSKHNYAEICIIVFPQGNSGTDLQRYEKRIIRMKQQSKGPEPYYLMVIHIFWLFIISSKSLLEHFYGCKIISSKTRSKQKFSTKYLGRKCFMAAKPFPLKQVFTQNFGCILSKGKWPLHEGIFEYRIYCESYDYCREVSRR